MKRIKAVTAIFFCTLCCAIAVCGYYADKRITVQMTSAEVKNAVERPVLIIDAGHGGFDGGCVSINKKCEKDINLNILLSLRDIANIMGYDTVCTRESDVSIHDEGVKGALNQKKSDMKNRLEIINSRENAIAVLIHQNQFTDSRYSGAQMFYSPKVEGSEELADIMQKRFVSNLQPDNKREIKQVKDEIYLLNNAKCPSVMVECGFLSNKEEADKLENPDYQKLVAFTVFSGVSEYESNHYFANKKAGDS
ncbi:MAG: N-acetylmuramoyl-L-alanine amidase [Oscillospiraceae bacterium]